MTDRALWCGGRRLLLDRTRVMGVLNVTPDSFSDGGRFFGAAGPDLGALRDHAVAMIESGVDILDVGGESTRPGAQPVAAVEELRRVVPVLETLQDLDTIVSVDTCKAEVARTVLTGGCHLINDVSGLADDAMAAVLADSNAALCIMHMLGKPRTMQMNPDYEDVTREVRCLLQTRVDRARSWGITDDRLCIDPGIGFGKTLAHNLTLLKQIESLRFDDLPILVGLSRKQMIGRLTGRYIEFCKASVSRGFRLAGMNIVLDCANGATYHVAPLVLEELGANVTVIGAEPDGFNINEGCGSTAPAALAARVLELGADLGIALDGDGDRLIMVDNTGAVVDGDQLIYAMANHRAGNGTLQGGVVGTLMSNFGLERAFTESGIEFFRANVGDRYVLEALRERGWSLGGESSGHIICLDLTTTGDAIVAALQVVSAMSDCQRTLSELVGGMTKAPQTLLNVAVAAPQQRVQEADVVAAVEAKSRVLAGRGRVLIRPSGTEPVVRVMVEGDSAVEVTAVAEELAAVVGGKPGD